MNAPIYKKLWFIILVLVIFPPAGIPLLWLYGNMGKKNKLILSVVFALLFLIVVIPKGNSQPASGDATVKPILSVSLSSSPSVMQSPTVKLIPTPTTTPTMTPALTISPTAEKVATPTPTIKPTPSPTPTPKPTLKPTAKPTVKPTVKPTTKPSTDPIVYITDTGKKYHTSGCRYLNDSKKAVKLSWAKANGYTACGVCHPPK